MRLRSIREIKSLKGKRVLVRVDFNVSIKNGTVPRNELTRLRATLPTILWLQAMGAKIILLTHLGRPKAGFVKELSVKPLTGTLSKLLKTRVRFAVSFGSEIKKLVDQLKNSDVLLLENIRFMPGEEKNDRVLAKQLAGLADIYVNDAFAVSHRAHTSVSVITKFLPSFAGFLLEEEVKNLSRLLIKPKSPFVVLMGGAKISTKIPVLKNLLRIADHVLVAGGIATTILKAQGYEVGSSLVDAAGLARAKRFAKNKKLILPRDALLFNKKNRALKKVEISDHPGKICDADFAVYDIGPKTIKTFSKFIGRANTAVWNGPLGVCEDKRFCRGTKILAKVFAKRMAGPAFGVIGGGDTLPVIESVPNIKKVDFISTGGGAMLEFLGGKILPGIKPLING